MRELRVILVLSFVLFALIISSCEKGSNPVEVERVDRTLAAEASTDIRENTQEALYIAPYSADEPERVDDPVKVGLILSSLSEHSRERLLTDGAILVSDVSEIELLTMITSFGEGAGKESFWIILLDGVTSWTCIKCCYGGPPCCKKCPCCDDHSPKRDYSPWE